LLEDLPAAAAANLGDQAAHLSPAQRDLAMQALAEVFSAQRSFSAVADHLGERYDPEHERAISAWYRSELGRRLRGAEKAAQSERVRATLETFREAVRKIPPTAERLELARRYDLATESSKNLIRVTVGVAASGVAATNALLPAGHRASGEEVEAALATVRDEMSPLVTRQSLYRILFVLRSFQKAEIEEILRAVEGPAGRWFYSGLGSGLEEVVLSAVDELGRRLQEAE
jgi:hypothetical protein